MDYYSKALMIIQRFYGEDHPATAVIINNIGKIKEIQSHFNVALDNYFKSIKKISEVLWRRSYCNC